MKACLLHINTIVLIALSASSDVLACLGPCPTPLAPTLVSPDNSCEPAWHGITFNWNTVSGATHYQVFTRVVGSSTWQQQAEVSHPTSSWTWRDALPGRTYKWKMQSINKCGSGRATGTSAYSSEKTFAISPAPAGYPHPSDEAQGVSTTEQLSWTAATGATSHDVYFGEHYILVSEADTQTPGIYKGRQTGTTYVPDLEAGKTYYWRIDEVRDGCIGDPAETWSFTVESLPQFYTLNIMAEHGSVIMKVDDEEVHNTSFSPGTAVELTAYPDISYFFTEWSGDASGPDNPVMLVMDDHKTVEAVFAAHAYNLVVNSYANYTVAPPEEPYIHGTSVTVETEEVTGYDFTGWTGTVSSLDNPFTFIISTDTELTANYQIKRYALSTSTNGGMGSLQCSPASSDGEYNHGTVVFLTAFADTGYRFKGWSGNLSGTENPKTLFMDGPKAVSVIFERTGYVLNLGANDPEGGLCNPSYGNRVYTEGAEVVVHAFPLKGYKFTGWTGSAAGLLSDALHNKAVFTMGDEDCSLIANFETSEILYTLNISSDENGTTVPAPSAYQYPSGPVAVEGIPHENFIRWEGSYVDAGKLDNPYQPEIEVNIENNYSLHAVFNYKLNVSRNCTGGTVVSPGLGVYPQPKTNPVVSIEAVPYDGFKFDTWSGPAVGAERVACPGSASTTVTMDGDYTIEANFAVNQYNLVVSGDSNGTLIEPAAGIYLYDYKTIVPVEARAETGYHFSGWTGTAVDAGQVLNPNSSKTSVSMDGKSLADAGQYTLTANFAIDEYVIDISSTKGGYIDVSGDGLPDSGIFAYTGISTVNIQAYVEPGYTFVGWAGTAAAAQKIPDLESGTTTLTVDGNYTLRAVFVPIKATVIYVSSNGDGTDGLSWKTAFHCLQEALEAAVSGNQIWISAGTYYPTNDPNRAATFQLVPGVEVYGGFAGIEDSVAARNLKQNPTLLSGDIGIVGDSTDNSYHVVTAADGAVLDGFTVTGGYADANEFPNNCGAGIRIHFIEDDVYVRNCTITGNFARYGGGAHSFKGKSKFFNCYFDGNTANETGGAIYNEDSESHYQNCNFLGNIDLGNAPAIQQVIIDNITPAWSWDTQYANPNWNTNWRYEGQEGQEHSILFETFQNSSYPGTITSDEYQIRWGIPASMEPGSPTNYYYNVDFFKKSGLGFIGYAPPIRTVGLDSGFQIGRLQHMNNRILSASSIVGANLNIKLSLNNPVVDEKYFEFFLHVNETPNNCQPQPRCADDIITFPESFPFELIEINSHLYTLKILGFGANVHNLDPNFLSPEDETNTAYLWAQITPPAIDGSVKNVRSGIVFDNCVFAGNQSNGFGGALSNWTCRTELKNCTVVSNNAYHCGGIYSFESDLDIANSIVWGNTDSISETDLGKQIYHKGGDLSITYSCIGSSSPYPGDGNTKNDPMFVRNPYDGGDGWGVGGNDDYGNLRLMAGSPCIDAGTNEGVSVGVTRDIDGRPRFVDDPDSDNTGNGLPPIVDMGAYEFQAGNTPPIAVDDVLAYISTNQEFAETYIIPVAELLKNDEDVDNDTLAFHSVSQPSSGTLIPVSGAYEYTPDFPGAGTATFTYTIFDGITVSEDATVTIVITEIGNLTVNAGSPQTVTLGADGTVQVTLYDASITGDGVINPGAVNINKSWTASYVPPTGSVDWANQDDQLQPTLTLTIGDPAIFSFLSEVQFELILYGEDSANASRHNQNSVVITVLQRSNCPPQVDAGAYDPLAWPDGTRQPELILDGTVTDDGLPNGMLFCRWTVVEGGSRNVIFEDDEAEDTLVTFTRQGHYRLRLTASDTELSEYAETLVVVGQGLVNQPPDIKVSEPNVVITLSHEPAVYLLALEGDPADDDDGLLRSLEYTWSPVPDDTGNTPVNGAQLSDIHAREPLATFTKPGTYQFQIEAYDGQYSAYDYMTVTAVGHPTPIELTVDAGPDKTIRLPAGAHLIGSYQLEQGDPNNLAFQWCQISGPSRAKFLDGSDTELHAKVDFVYPGEYIFRLEGNYNSIYSDVDDVKVMVKRGVKIVDSSHFHTLLIDDSTNAGVWSTGLNRAGEGGRPIKLWPRWVGEEFPYPHFHNACDISYSFEPVFPADQLDPVYNDLSIPPQYITLIPPNQIFEFYDDYTKCQGQFNNAIEIATSLSASLVLDSYGHVWRFGELSASPRDGLNTDVFNPADFSHPYWSNFFYNTMYGPGGMAAPLPILCGEQDSASGLLKNIISIDLDRLTAFALEANGDIWWWGSRTGPAASTYRPVRFYTGTNEILSNIVNISTVSYPNLPSGDGHATLFLEDLNFGGRVYCYDAYYYNDYYYSRYNDYIPSPEPDQQLSNIVNVSASSSLAMTLEMIDIESDCDGNVYIWRVDSEPSILYGNVNFNDTGSVLPVRVSGGDQGGEYLRRIVDVSLDNHAMALEEINPSEGFYGCVYTWGDNWWGQLGNGTCQTTAGKPIRVFAPDLNWDGVSDEKDWAEYGSEYLKDIVAIYSGVGSSFAVDKDGRVFAWGYGYLLGLGIEDVFITSPREVPLHKRVHNIDTGIWYYRIQEAIEDEATLDGHHIVVSEGLYFESIDFMGKHIALTGEDPCNPDVVRKTIVKGVGGDAITIDAIEFAEMSGFTINCHNGDGGVLVNNSSNIILSNNIIHNTGGTGVTVSGNSQAIGIFNNRIYGNSIGIVTNNSADVCIRNNTITENTSQGVALTQGPSPRLINNIIWNNGAEPHHNSLSSNVSGISDYSFCCIGGLTEPYSNGNFSSDPGFNEADYTLEKNSPCINAGFMDTVVDGTAVSITPGNLGFYQEGDTIEINNDRIPRVITGINGGQLQFTPALVAVPSEGWPIINWCRLAEHSDITTIEGSTDTFVIRDASLYRIGDTVLIGDADYRTVTHVHREGRVTFTPEVTTGIMPGTQITVWDYSSINGGPRVAGGRVDIGADEFRFWQVNAGQDSSITVSEPFETKDASIRYMGFSDVPGPDEEIQIKWSVADSDAESVLVTFGNSTNNLIVDTLHTAVDFHNKVGTYQLQLTVYENELPIAWDTVNVNVMYDIHYTSIPAPPAVVAPADTIQIQLDILGDGSRPYEVEWSDSPWLLGPPARFTDNNDNGPMTDVSVLLEHAGYYPLSVQLRDQASGGLMGNRIIGVCKKQQFTSVDIHTDVDEIILPKRKISFEGRFNGSLESYSLEWIVSSRDGNKEAAIVYPKSWTTEITFNEPGIYDVYLVVKQIERLDGLWLPRYAIVGVGNKTVQVHPPLVDAGSDQTIQWPQNFAYLYGQVEGGDSLLWSCDDPDVTIEDNSVQNPKVTFPNWGWYILTLSAFSGNDEWGSDEVNIFVNAPDVIVEAGEDKAGYIGKPIPLNDVSSAVPAGFDILWFTPSDKGFITHDNELPAEIVFIESGEYQVYLLAVYEGAVYGADSLLVTVHLQGGVTIVSNPGSPIEFLERQNVQLAGDLDSEVYLGGELPFGVTPRWIISGIDIEQADALITTVSFPDSGHYQVRLELLENGICIDYAAQAVFVKAPPIRADAKIGLAGQEKDEYVQVFDGDPIELSVKGLIFERVDNPSLITWMWSATGPAPVTWSEDPPENILEGITARFTKAGDYVITLSVFYSDQFVVQDTVDAALLRPGGQPIVRAGRNYPLAIVNQPLHLSKARIWDDQPLNDPGAVIQWTCPDGDATIVPSTVQNPYVTFAEQGRYDLTLTFTDADGLYDSDTVTIYAGPHYSVFAGSQRLTHPYTDLTMSDASVTPKSSAYTYEWSSSSSEEKIKFKPDRFCLNPTLQFEEIGDYTVTLNVSKQKEFIGSHSVLIQVRQNPNTDTIAPKITDFNATYGTGEIDVDGKADVRGPIQISVSAEDNHIARIELSLYETANPSNKQLIEGGVYSIEAGTPANPIRLRLTHCLDAYLSGEVTLEAKAFDRAGNFVKKIKTFTSLQNIAHFEVDPIMIEGVGETLTFRGTLNTNTECNDWVGTDWTLSIQETSYQYLDCSDAFEIVGNLDAGDNIFNIQMPGVGRYTATLTAGNDTSTRTFDVIADELGGELSVEIDSALKPTKDDGTDIPLGSISTIRDGIYILKGKACHTNLLLNPYVQYRLVLSNQQGFSRNVTPGNLKQGFFSGFVSPEPGSGRGDFGMLDFTGVPNGIYTLTLTVRCMGVVKNDSVEIAISSPLKIGHVTFSQEDMSINVGGYPISVIRTYDGLNRHRKGDFGYGWTYALANMDIELNETRIDKGTHTQRSGDIYNRDVTLTLPDSQRVTFTSHYIINGSSYYPSYSIPDNSGVEAFTIKGNDFIDNVTKGTQRYLSWSTDYWNPTTEYLKVMDECLTLHDFQGFLLTMKDGTAYHIKREAYDKHTVSIPPWEGWHDDEVEICTFTPYGKPYLGSIDLPTGEIIVFELDRSGDVLENPTIKAVWLFPASVRENDFNGDSEIDLNDIAELKNHPSDYSEHSSGGINIFHDQHNRIIAIYGPSEAENLPADGYSNPLDYRDIGTPAVKYFYMQEDEGIPDNGNLIRVERLIDARGEGNQDDEYERTYYDYENTVYKPADHYVTAIRDERGFAPIRYEYDGQGRLIATIDAKGNRIEIKHNLLGTEKTEIITDRTGRTTVYGYNSRGNVTFVRKLDRQGEILEEVIYQYDDVNYQDAPSHVINSVPDYENGGFIDAVTESRYDSAGRARLVIDPAGNATETGYDSVGNVIKSVQWHPVSESASFVSGYPVTNSGSPTDYSIVSVTENAYTSNYLLKRTEIRDSDAVISITKWYSMSINLYDGRNRILHSIQIDADAIADGNVSSFRAINSINDLANLPGQHIITSYVYDVYPDYYPVVDKRGEPTNSGSADQPFSISSPYSAGDSPVYTQFHYYNLNNQQTAGWQDWDDASNGAGCDARILTIYENDAQGRNRRTIQITQYFDNAQSLDDPDFDTIFENVDDYIADKEAVILGCTTYNAIGKIWKAEGRHLPDEEGSLSVYAYDETGNLVETRTYANKSDYIEAYPNFNVLTISRTLYDAEGRTLVTVGPYDPSDTDNPPVGTEYRYDELGRNHKTARWSDVKIPLVDLYGSNGGIAGLRLPSAAKPATACDGSTPRPANIGWTVNGGSLPTIGQEQSYTRTVYDIAGRVQMYVTLDEDGAEQPASYEYDVAGRQIAAIDPLGHTISRIQDGKWHVIDAMELNAAHRSITHYDGNRRDYVVDAASNSTSFKYDALGRVITTIHPPTLIEGSQDPVHTYSHVGYDGLGRKTWETEPVLISNADFAAMDQEEFDQFIANNTKQFAYDSAGRLIMVILPAVDDPEDSSTDLVNPVYDYFYDDCGNMVGICDPKGRLTVFKFDPHGRQTHKYMPFVHTTPIDREQNFYSQINLTGILFAETAYDALGRLEWEKDYKGQFTVYAYYDQTNFRDGDVLFGLPGQLMQIDCYDGDPDGSGQLKSSLNYVYDALGRKKTETMWEDDGSPEGLTRDWHYGYDAEGNIKTIDSPQGRVGYQYNAITGQKQFTYTGTGGLSAPETLVGYGYDDLGRLKTAQTMYRNGNSVTGELTQYGYNAVGSRDWMKLPNEIYTRYSYNAMHRLTDVVHYTQIPQENPPLPPTLSSFNYPLYANGMRSGVTEYVNQNRYLTYQYDGLNRLVREDSYDDAAMNPALNDGYTAQYDYDLVGNRKERVITANGQTLTTAYAYYPDTDRLMTETHTGPIAAMPYGDGQRIYAYADGSGGMVWQLPGSNRRIGQFGAFLRGLPSVWNRAIFYMIMLLIPVVILGPVVVRQWSRIKGGIDPLASPDLKLWHRVLCVLLAYIFLVGPEAFHMLAQAETQYSQLSTLAWGKGNTIIEYGYDANGSLTSKTTTEGTTTVEQVAYDYNLQNRLAKVTTTPYAGGTPQATVVEYRYNPSGIRVEKTETTSAGRTETHYLVDPQNHTGYAQVLEETVEQYDSSDVFLSAHRIQYTIGDDVISQTRSEWSGSIWQAAPTQYLLYDGHGSTRQLVNPAQTIVDSYSYDAYGVMLGSAANPADSADTNYLYTGQQYDSAVQQYYLRARYYNPSNGLFNRVDPYSGNLHDPQSLHKYLYCHNNPVNNIDPSGMMTLISIMSTMSNICRAFMKYYPILKVGLIVADILCVTNILLKAITQGISSVTAGEWAELALITGTAFFGGKAARRVAKVAIKRALGLTDDALRSFKGLSRFIKSKGIILEVDDIIKYNKEGKKVLGSFDLVGKNADKPIIYLNKGGHTISTLMHEYVHYFQWKYFVGGTKYDWLNFSNIGQTKDHLEAVAYLIGDVFLK